VTRESEANRVGLPIRPFMYTLDQVADLLGVTQARIKSEYGFFDGIHTGKPALNKLRFRNISPQEDVKEWRVSEKELIRWLKNKGFRIIEPTKMLN